MNQVTQCLKADGFQTGLDIVRPCFSPDSDYVAAGGHDGGVYIWSTVSGNLEICLRDHTCVIAAQLTSLSNGYRFLSVSSSSVPFLFLGCLKPVYLI
ncbi:unnamed protein product [Schistosoma curassoni]|uniref:WD_REPEATS_REGION domain-containing protein n=1 Tax=Schistosoma curassoni TaxID=6186 RepID=A0A183JUX8_9TREM|nr:unnamed protein product [Schistosoma curassoni]